MKDEYLLFRELLCWKTKTNGGRYYQDIIHDPPKNQKLQKGETRETRRYLRIKGGVAKNEDIIAMAKKIFGSDAVRTSSPREGLWNGQPEPILHITLPDELFEE